MRRWHVSFSGRKVGAIGVPSRYTRILEADESSELHLKLYETHEHITGMVWREMCSHDRCHVAATKPGTCGNHEEDKP